MIKEIRNQSPFIHLGFNKQSVTAYAGQDITIWQDKIYINDYDETLVSLGATVTESGLNKVVLSYDTVGTYQVQLNVSNRDKTITKASNELTIIVEPITFGNKVIKWGNTQITFND